MPTLLTILGTSAILLILWDALETILLPRTVDRKFGLTTLYFSRLDRLFQFVGKRLRCDKNRRERILGAYAPIAMLLLLAFWATGLILCFAVIHLALGTSMTTDSVASFGEYCYFSATTFFTLGFGDITPVASAGRTLAVLEAGLGFGFLALMIGYIPVLYQNFSRREATILLLDARAGSPPSAGTLLARQFSQPAALESLLAELERWAASLLESYLSYPILAYYRSQHAQMSWLSAVAMTLDTCAFIVATADETDPGQKSLKHQAELTFALNRHMLVDLAYVLGAEPHQPQEDRLTPQNWESLVRSVGPQRQGPEQFADVTRLRSEYEPYLAGLASNLFLDLQPWLLEETSLDSWQTSAWDEGAHF